jgi:hypothetical protein
MQLERGREEGTPHVQFCAKLSRKTRPSAFNKHALFNFPGLLPVHVEAMRPKSKYTDLVHYCGKPCPITAHCDKCANEGYTDADRIDGPYDFGEVPENKQGQRTDLEAFADRVIDGEHFADIASDMPGVTLRYLQHAHRLLSLFRVHRYNADRRKVLYVGPTRCGKSRRARDLPEGYTDRDFWEQPIGDGFWFDGVDGCKVVLFDEFDGKFSSTPLRLLLRVTDNYTLRVPSKGGFQWYDPERVLFTTNYHPWNWYDWNDRVVQYAALAERFDFVVWWTARGAEPSVLRRDTPRFAAFWSARPVMNPVQGHVEGNGIEQYFPLRDYYQFF